ncbi:MAG: SMI1/KNR4 family protein [Gemmataceae bacterium]
MYKLWKCLYPPRPAAADLDQTEQLLGCRLPASYRAFVERFGLGGEIAGWCRLVPLVGKANDFFTVVGRTREMKRRFITETEDAKRLGESFVANLVAFGSTGGGDSYAFHTSEITDRKRSEYRVYQFGRLGGWKEAHGNTFAELIDHTARMVRGWRIADDPAAAWPEGEIVYWPSFARRSLPFTKKAAAGWRTSTVAALTDAILADRACERLPLLADALEEAGCEDPHLLQACRSGNWQSDGEWVLGVLENVLRGKK